MQHDYTIASASVAPLSGGLIVQRARGLITRSVMSRCQDDSSEYAKLAAGLMIDWRPANLLIDWNAIADIVPRPTTETMPVALLVSQSMLPPWRIFAQRQAERGVVRQVFTDESDALSWLAPRAQAMEAEMRLAASRLSAQSWRTTGAAGSCPERRQAFPPDRAPAARNRARAP